MRLKMAKLTMCLMLAASPFTPEAAASRGDTRSDVRSSAASSRGSASIAERRILPRVTRNGNFSGNFGGGISCVPYARSVTGMDISGNGRDWWHNAAGRYARGQRPQVGSVLAWPGSGNMSSGHVAVVSRVLHGRMIEIDHANWGGPGIQRGTVMRNVQVMDVSDDNSWTRVRVQTGWTAANFGREYPTYGFIHNRPNNMGTASIADDMIRPVIYSTRIASPRRATGAAHTPVVRAAVPRGAIVRAPMVRGGQARVAPSRAPAARAPVQLAKLRATR